MQALYSRLWGSGFLPSKHQGVSFQPSGDPVLFLSNPAGVKTISVETEDGSELQQFKQAGGEILLDDGHYCHAIFTSSLFRFKDDFEAELGDARIEVRSASRCVPPSLPPDESISSILVQYRQSDVSSMCQPG